MNREENLERARIICQEKDRYRIRFETDGAEEAAVPAGRFRISAEGVKGFPAVGDYVLADRKGGSIAVIQEILPRKTVFSRRAAGRAGTEQIIAANIDLVFICMSLNRDFNVRRAERYLSLVREAGAEAVILLTKTDLCADAERMKDAVREIARDTEVCTVTSMREDGYDEVLRILESGKTYAFAGSSGVGKSTLINRLLGEYLLRTGELGKEGKGCHTTTFRELFSLENGAFVIDTPGMRELGMTGGSTGIRETFQEVESLSRLCRFRDCTHTGEPGCAVRQAEKDGILPRGRLESYRKLVSESQCYEDAADYLRKKEKKFREIAKINKGQRRKRIG